MQPTKNEEAPRTRMGSRTQPTEEQEEYARGFEVALGQIYAQRGAPVVVRVRSQSTSSDIDPLLPSNFASQPSAGRPGQSSSSLSTVGSSVTSTAVSPSVGSRCLPAVVTDMMAPGREGFQPASTKIPLFVAGLALNDDFHLLSDESLHHQPTSDSSSTGMKNTVCWCVLH